jgi:TRAP-type transport system periplasmic protein
MLSRRRFIANAGATTALLPLATPALSQNRVDIRVSHVLPSTHLGHGMVEEITARITERTNGRLNFVVFPNSQLGTTTETVEQASQGLPVISYTDASTLAPFGVPELNVLGGPFLVEDIEEAFRLHDSDLMSEWSERLAQQGAIRNLALNWLPGARHIVGHNAYPEPEDLRGVAIRVPPIETWRRTFLPLGAIPTTVEFAEVYSALSQGVVDAAENSLMGIASQNWHEVAKEVTLTGHFMAFSGWVISEAAFAEMSAEEQAIMKEEFRAGGVEYARALDADIADTMAALEAQGVNITQANTEAYRQATASFYEAFPEWPEGLFERVRAAAAG